GGTPRRRTRAPGRGCRRRRRRRAAAPAGVAEGPGWCGRRLLPSGLKCGATAWVRCASVVRVRSTAQLAALVEVQRHVGHPGGSVGQVDDQAEPVHVGGRHRSEEHTSELQLRENLVCRLLLEKKKRIVRRLGSVISNGSMDCT